MKEGNEMRANGGLSQLDRYLRALNDEHRRYLLYHLDESGVANTEELARHVAARESDRPPSEIDRENWESVRTTLHHQHLPRLADYGIVDYDERSEDVCLDDPPRVFEILLQFCRLVEDDS